MVCRNCHKQAHHIFSYEWGDLCENCSDISVGSINKTDGLLTRNSWRVRRQQSRYEGDIIRPHAYDKNKHREVINPDFIKQYGPEKAKQFFSPEQMVKDGYKKLPQAIAEIEHKNAKLKEKYIRDTTFSGSSKKAIANFLGEKA